MSAADRLAVVEGELAQLRAQIAAPSTSLSPQPTGPDLERFNAHEAARAQRRAAALAESDRHDAQVARDAPKQAKRDAALAALDEQIQRGHLEHEQRQHELVAKRTQLANAPL